MMMDTVEAIENPRVHSSQLCHVRQKGHGVVDGGAAQDDTGKETQRDRGCSMEYLMRYVYIYIFIYLLINIMYIYIYIF